VTLAAAILLSSLLGSIHCVAMCGPLVGLAGGARTLRLALVHSLGRLATYATLGVAAGAVGRVFELGLVQRAATVVAGALILGWGLGQLAVAVGWRRPRAGREPRAFGDALVKLRTRRPAARAYLIGMLVGLLPCGWLWAFVIAAGGTGDPLHGGLVMAAFWLGTVPAMVGVLTVAGPAIAWLRARMPVVTAVALIALGIGTLASRWPDAGTRRTHCHMCDS
jgi:uncharacterized protein